MRDPFDISMNTAFVCYDKSRHQISSALGFEEAESCDCQQITRRHNIRICYVITRNCHGRKIKPKTKCCRWKWVWINRWKVTSLSDNVHSQVCRKTVELEQLSEIWNLISDPYPVVQLPLSLHWFILMLALGIDP